MSGVARPAVGVIYAAALLQGLTLVSFPASSGVLKAAHGISDTQYGLIFLPQVGAAVLGALLGGALIRRIGLKNLLLLALLGNAASQALLAGLNWLPQAQALSVLLLATAALGLGFGFFGAPMNAYPPLLFPRTHDTAIVAEHSVMGIGLMAGPVLLSLLTPLTGWVGFPLALAAFGALLLAGAALFDMGPDEAPASGPQPAEGAPARAPLFWAFAVAGVVYAFAEGTFSNWAVIYLQGVPGISAAAAGIGLSAFWGGLVGGRLAVSALVLKVPAPLVWVSLPLLMALAFWLLPTIHSAEAGWLLFAFSGLACSAFFPLTVALATSRFAQHAAWVSSMLIAALNIGTGIGSYLVGYLQSILPLQVVYHASIAYPAVVLLIAVPVALRSRAKT